MKAILAICDGEKAYAQRLMEYLSSKNAFLLKAAAFSAAESLCAYAKKHPIAVLLISEKMMNEETAKIKAEKVIILKEEKGGGENAVYKYQAGGQILREIMSFYDAENAAEGTDTNWRGKKQVIGIYSPVGGTRKTSFALTLGQLLAREAPALYINLEGFSGLSDILGMSFEAGLSDFLYYVQQTDTDPLARLETLTVSASNLDILPPAESPEDLRSIHAGPWTALCSRIMSESAYETLILDLGPEVEDLAAILGFCTRVYVPVREDALAEARLLEFSRYLQEYGGNTENIKKLKLPFHLVQDLGKAYYENLVWSELGDFTRHLIKEERR